jgi:electron transport complex protein RnfC
VPPSAPAALAPVGGTVGGVATVRLTSGREMPAITLEPAPDEVEISPTTEADGATKLKDLLSLAQPADLSRYTDLLRSAGVWADRWTSPDLLGQLNQCLKRPVDTVLCNALDFDDALPMQRAVVCEYALEIVAAVALLGALTGATRAAVVVDSAGGDACVKAIERWAAQTGVRAVGLRNSYPQANPTLLLHAVARRPLRPGRLPTETGAVVLDAMAAAAAGRCLLYAEPALRTMIGVADMRGTAGPGDGRSRLLSVPIGMKVGDVLREAGVAQDAFELRGSSPLRDVRLPPECIVSAGGESALYLVAPQPHVNPDPCIRCGWCVSGCPVHIHPAGILQAAQVHDHAAAERYGIDSCIECGICSYVCPSQLPLLPGIRELRAAAR